MGSLRPPGVSELSVYGVQERRICCSLHPRRRTRVLVLYQITSAVNVRGEVYHVVVNARLRRPSATAIGGKD